MTLSIKPFKIGMRAQGREWHIVQSQRYWNSISLLHYTHLSDNFIIYKEESSVKLCCCVLNYLFRCRWGLWYDRRRIRLLFSRFRTLCSSNDIPRTLLLLVLGGIGWFDAYYNRYFGILLIAPFVLTKGTVILCV